MILNELIEPLLNCYIKYYYLNKKKNKSLNFSFFGHSEAKCGPIFKCKVAFFSFGMWDINFDFKNPS